MNKIILVILTCLYFFSSNLAFAQGFADFPWPMFGHDPGHTHRGVFSPPATNVLKWKFKAESGIFSPVIAVDGTIYAGSYDKHIYALKPDGSLKWKYLLNSPIIQCSSTIGNDGSIYIGSAQDSPNSLPFFYAFNPDGSLKWKFNSGLSFSSPVIGYDGTIFAGSSDSYLYAFSSGDSLKWKYKFAYNHAMPTIGRDGTVYFSSGDSFLNALNHDGTLKWKLGPDIADGPPPSIGEDGTIYVVNRNRGLSAFNPDGTLKWSLRLTESYFQASPAISHDGTIYIGSMDFVLYAVKPDGTLKWKFLTGGPILQAAAIGSDGCIYVPTDEEDHYMYAINPDGTLRWKFPIGRATTPVFGADGTLYFGSLIGYLCALAPETPSGIQSDSTSFSFEKPYPNPFNPSTTLTFSLNIPSQVKIAVYSINGQKIADLANKTMSAGHHSVVFDGSKYASGIYFCRFETNKGIKTGKMLLVK